jgi:hypothetical protein
LAYLKDWPEMPREKQGEQFAMHEFTRARGEVKTLTIPQQESNEQVPEVQTSDTTSKPDTAEPATIPESSNTDSDKPSPVKEESPSPNPSVTADDKPKPEPRKFTPPRSTGFRSTAKDGPIAPTQRIVSDKMRQGAKEAAEWYCKGFRAMTKYLSKQEDNPEEWMKEQDKYIEAWIKPAAYGTFVEFVPDNFDAKYINFGIFGGTALLTGGKCVMLFLDEHNAKKSGEEPKYLERKKEKQREGANAKAREQSVNGTVKPKTVDKPTEPAKPVPRQEVMDLG